MANDTAISIRAMKFMVADIGRVTDFYQKVFGFELDKTITFGEVTENVLLVPGSEVGLALIQHSDEPVTPGTAHGPLVIETDDVKGLADDVVSAGGTITMGPLELPNACLAVVTDPEGHSLELVHLPNGALNLDELDVESLQLDKLLP